MSTPSSSLCMCTSAFQGCSFSPFPGLPHGGCEQKGHLQREVPQGEPLGPQLFPFAGQEALAWVTDHRPLLPTGVSLDHIYFKWHKPSVWTIWPKHSNPVFMGNIREENCNALCWLNKKPRKYFVIKILFLWQNIVYKLLIILEHFRSASLSLGNTSELIQNKINKQTSEYY